MTMQVFLCCLDIANTRAAFLDTIKKDNIHVSFYTV